MYTFKGINQLQADLRAGVISCHALTTEILKASEEKKHLNIFLELFHHSALKQASAVDEKIKNGTAGKLAGVIVGLKDNICYKGHRVSASSKILEGFESLYSATVTERLLAEDAIIIGRCNCDEFAMGSSNENSAYGNVLNPLNERCVPGGSSGGAAAAIAAGLCHVTLGSDTGGSIRQPASFTGTVGIKPTYGRVSRYGLIAYASSFDQIGPITKTVEDNALVLEIISGQDKHDNTSSSRAVDEYCKHLSENKTYKIAYLKECVENPGLDPEIRQNVDRQIEALRKAGHQVEPVGFPYLDYLVPIYYVITTAEASSNLSRFAGMHYGYRSKNATDLESTFKKSRSEGFGKEVKRRIMLGTFVLSAGYYDAYYKKAQQVRALITADFHKIFENFEMVVSPTAPSAAFKFGAKSDDPIQMYMSDIASIPANLAGLPGISLPCGLADSNMPVGIQLVGRPMSDASLLQTAQGLETALDLKLVAEKIKSN